jgi:competence ComEA-like helix-hairpin-helix protein
MRLRTAPEVRGALLAIAIAVFLGLPRPVREAPPAPPPVRPSPGDTARASGGRLELNRADAGALRALPGIGPVLAERIVAHRSRHGPFETLDDLRAVRGIGPRLIERIRSEAAIVTRSDSTLR